MELWKQKAKEVGLLRWGCRREGSKKQCGPAAASASSAAACVGAGSSSSVQCELGPEDDPTGMFLDQQLEELSGEASAGAGGKRRMRWRLLQFDKSVRPAFYGSWPAGTTKRVRWVQLQGNQPKACTLVHALDLLMLVQ